MTRLVGRLPRQGLWEDFHDKACGKTSTTRLVGLAYNRKSCVLGDLYQNWVEFHQKVIGAPTRSSEIYEQSYLQSRSLAESVTFL